MLVENDKKITEEGCRRLAGGILIQTIRDWNKRNCKAEIAEFLHSEWCEVLANFVEISPTEIDTRLRTGSVSARTIRAAYRKSFNPITGIYN
jgi:hypothetical protein